VNKGSFAICQLSKTAKTETSKPIVLVRCNRLDHKDNDRGMKLSVKFF